MSKTVCAAHPILLFALIAALGACSEADSTMSPAGAIQPTEAAVEEPDLYKQEGGFLYVQNHSSGLNIIDVSAPASPRLLGRAPTSGARGGELFLRPNLAVLVLESASSSCTMPGDLASAGWSLGAELTLVDTTAKSDPRIIERYCIPGTLVSARARGDIVFLVTTDGFQSRVLSLRTTDPTHVTLVAQATVQGAGEEILMTSEVLFVASQVYSERTNVEIFQLDLAGNIRPRGAIEVPGMPQGRFHMDYRGTQFRIVTFSWNGPESILHVIDVSNMDEPALLGSLGGIGRGEQLYATRFDRDKAYVVTFRQTDPLWVISLTDPTQPTIIGELEVPGWSDFIFPLGSRLLAVGRGDGGAGVGVSLFDVSDPTRPRAIDQISVGSWGTSSEANVDHRGVTIVEQDGQWPLVIIPLSRSRWDDDNASCTTENSLQLVEIEDAALAPRATVAQKGLIRRTLPLSTSLYSISDHEVLALDISDRDAPRVQGNVTIGIGESTEPDYPSCPMMWGDDVVMEGPAYPFMFTCNAGAEAGNAPPISLLLLLLGWVILRRRRRQA